MGLVRKRKRRVVRTTDSNHALPVAPNRLNRNFAPGGQDRVWVSDITDIPTRQGLGSLASLGAHLGDIFAFIAALTFAVYTVLLRFKPRDVGEKSFLLLMAWCGSLPLVPFMAWELARGAP